MNIALICNTIELIYRRLQYNNYVKKQPCYRFVYMRADAASGTRERPGT
jgi:hypothetical protein